ncbi:MAG: hypothetical protein GHCLOJNM_03642 [bacterium]|nr:hypothetical protein [bacterium]
MIKEIAVDPEVLADWNGYRIVFQGCGVEKGRLIWRFPEDWPSKVVERIDQARKTSQLQPVKAKTIIEDVRKSYRRKTVPSRRRYASEKSWLENAENEHQREPFSLIVCCGNPQSLSGVLAADDITEETDGWYVNTGKKVERTASNLADCARVLLSHSTRIIFVDPYFDPQEEKFLSSLRAFLSACPEAHGPKRKFELHSKVQAKRNRDGQFNEESGLEWEKRCLSLRRILLPNISLSIFRWRDYAQGEILEGFHARYILTELGGIRFDWGLDEDPKRKKTDVQILNHDLYTERWRDFQEGSSPFDLDWKMKIDYSAD